MKRWMTVYKIGNTFYATLYEDGHRIDDWEFEGLKIEDLVNVE
jgi:hypothetical protein